MSIAILLNQPAIAQLIPHAGRMVLLEAVTSYDDHALQARSSSHRHPDNPLRRDGRLAVVMGAEYAAQAAAVHGALRAGPGAGPQPGYLAMLRNLRWTVARLDDLAADLEVCVQLTAAQTGSMMYDFRLAADDRTVLTGRLAVFFPATGQN